MPSILSVNNLNYKSFKDFNLEIEKNKITSIIAPNKSGKTMLTKILCAIIPTDDVCLLDGISLNKQNVLNYITKIGVATNDFNNQFLFKKVKDELAFPLLNLGYPEHKINKKIIKISKFFEIENLLNKKIDSLNKSLQNKLLIILALIHDPKVLILDDIFLEMNKIDQEFMLKKLKELNKDGLTILNITSKLDTIYDSDIVYVLNNFQIETSGGVLEILEQDNYLNEIGLQIPFIIDLSLKLKFYDLIDKIYFNIEDLEEDLWK
ncbi:MAG: ATP-binding cassette domain-containing protein [Bacilli bacterium]|nr:ATP-binding cassette domain-containing protein [Bacilli bacterium]